MASSIGGQVQANFSQGLSMPFCPVLRPQDMFHPTYIEFIRRGENLTREEYEEDKHVSDGIWTSALIKSWSRDIAFYPLDSLQKSLLARVGYCFDAVDRKHFKLEQDKWIAEEAFFCGLELHHQPDPEEVNLAYFVKHRNSERFRTWYTLMFPGKMNYWQHIPEAELFVDLASAVGDRDYWAQFARAEQVAA
jgi:hypothetical protein